MRKYDRMINETSVDSKLEFYENEELTEKSLPRRETNGPETKNGTIVNSLFVNVRKDPNPVSEVVEMVQRDEKVLILETMSGFYKVSTNKNNIGYISSKFVKEE